MHPAGRPAPAAPSFAAVLDPLLPRALRAARAFLGPGPAGGMAEDAVQEALLRAFRAWPALPDKERDVWPWLCTIVLRECRRLAGRERERTERLVPLPPGDGLDDGRPGAPAGPLEAVIAGEDRAEAVRALGALRGGLRTAAELRYVHGLSCADAAAVLGVPVGTLKWRMHAAHARLRAALVPGEEAGRFRPGWEAPPEAALPPAAPLPPVLRVAVPGASPGCVSGQAGGWPPGALEVPAADGPVHFAAPSRVAGRHPGAWVAAERAHHLWWEAAGRVWRACGPSVGAVRAAAEGRAAEVGPAWATSPAPHRGGDARG